MTIIVQDDHLTAEAWAACAKDSGIHKEWRIGILEYSKRKAEFA